MPTQPAIEVKDFAKDFFVGFRRKKVSAVKDVSFAVGRGEIFGFLGPNGAGKTTTIKALLALITPTSGTLNILGESVASGAWRSRLGYVPENPTFYEYLSGTELVTWFGRLAGLSAHEAGKQAKTALERVGLGASSDRRLRSYSKGMVQRAALAQAIVASPELLILDEPMTGLDPIGRAQIRSLIEELKEEGRTVFFSTHILADVEMICDRVAMLAQGETRQVGLLEEILGQTSRGVSVTLRNYPSDADVEGARVAYDQGGGVRLEFASAERARAFVGEALRTGAELVAYQPIQDDLESVFLKSMDPTEQIQS